MGDKVVSSNTDENHYQGATSIAVGTLNTIDADADAPFDGAASSVVGQVNYTKNTNAAVIMGAGNKVTNSYREVKLDEKTLQELIQAYQKKDMKTVTEILQKAVPESGGQVMVMGGGNTVDYAQDSQVMGVSNTLKGTKDAVSQYNLVDGFQNKVTNVQHTYVVGTNNTVDNTKNTIIHGDDNTVDKNGGKDSDNTRILGSGNKVEGSSSQVVIGDKNTITGRDEGTNSGNRISGISDITIGQGNYLGGAYTYRNTWDTLTVIGNNNNGKEHQEISSGIIIGDNQTIGGPEGIIDSIAIGSLSPSEQAEKDGKTAKYVVGRNSTIIGYHTTNPNGESVVIGNRSQANSHFETITGPRSIIEGAGYDSDTGNFSSIYGAFNTIKNGSSQDDVDGFGNSINGSLNVTSNARGAMIMGVGNTVEHSKGQDYTAKSAAGEETTKDFWLNDLSFGGDYYNLGVKGDLDISYDDMRRAIHDYMAASGGAVSVLGNSNTADYAIRSQILGTGNILKGAEDSTSAYNTISGFANTGSNVNRTSIVGTGNNLKNGEDNVVIGDYHQLDGGKHNVILGSMASKEQEVKKTSVFAALEAPDIPAGTDPTITYTVKEQVPVKANTANIENAVMLGYNTDVSESGGVALGSGSIASVKAGVFGWDPSTKAASTTDSNVWKSSWAAVSVGDAANKFTRQITNVAAGYNNTDAVNVAQLKAAMDNAGSKISLVAGDGIKIEGKDGTYTISANITGGKTATDTTKVDGKTGTSGDSGSTDKGNTDASGNGKQLVVTTDTNPTMFAADEGTAAEVKPSETLTINGDKTNIATKVNGNAISVKLKDDISVKTVNATSVTATDSIGIKDGPSMTTNGIDAAGKKITHVAAGTEATDAVNYGQLKDVESKVDSNSQAITNINSHVNRLDNRINKVGAGAAALAGLHPLDFDPADKWNFAVGYGNYRNANSVAVGAFYRPNGDTMVSVGTNFGNGENMVNAGVSFKLGQGSSYAGVSKAELAEENQKLKANDAAQDQKIQNQEKEIQELKKALEELKSHIK